MHEALFCRRWYDRILPARRPEHDALFQAALARLVKSTHFLHVPCMVKTAACFRVWYGGLSWFGTAVDRLFDDDALHRKAWEHMRCAEALCAAQMADRPCVQLAARNAQEHGCPSVQTSDRCGCGAHRAVGGQLRECGDGRQPLGHGRRHCRQLSPLPPAETAAIEKRISRFMSCYAPFLEQNCLPRTKLRSSPRCRCRFGTILIPSLFPNLQQHMRRRSKRNPLATV